MLYALLLDDLIGWNQLTYWMPQPVIMLGLPTSMYRPDFFCLNRTEALDVHMWCVEVKGRETEMWRRQRGLWKTWGPMPLRVVQLNHGAWTVLEELPIGSEILKRNVKDCKS